MNSPSTAGFQLSPQQKHLWSLQQNQQFVSQVAVLLEGPLDHQRLHAALMKIFQRHEILRTLFQRNAGMKFPFQVVDANATFSCFRSSVQAADEASEREQIQDALDAQAESDLFDGTALNVALIDSSENRHFVLFTLPALCADSASLARLAAELRELYTGTESEEAEALQYADYSEWQNELLQKNDEESRAGKEFWKQHDLSNLPPLVLPFEAKPRGESEFAPETVEISVDAGALGDLGDDPSAFLLAAWQVLLWRLTGQAEFAVAVLSDSRSHEELTNALGLFSKALPVYTNFETNRSFAEIVQSAAAARSAAIEQQDYFELSGQDLPVGFSVEEISADHSDGELKFSVYAQRCEMDRFHLQLKCYSQPGAWKLELVYDPSRLRSDVVKHVAHRFAILLSAAAADPKRAAGTLPIMDENERRQVLSVFNQTAAEFPREKCVHDLFEHQVGRRPDAPALRCGEQRFSYAELNARANRLGHLLRKRGVKNDVPVGLCVERSAEMIIGLLGILKAGGCYVPLVPDNPKSRLAHQLAETKAPVVVTQQTLLDRVPEFGGSTICLDRDSDLLSQESDQNPEHINTPDDLVYVIYTSGSTGVPKG